MTRLPKAAVLALLALPALAAAQAPPLRGMRILALEKLAPLPGESARELAFEAYGQRFDLSLQPNDRLAALEKAAGPGVEALRGRIEGRAGSWVRLTRTPAGTFGVMWDGRDLYAIEPARVAARQSVAPLQAADGLVIYRLADTVVPPGEMACGTVGLKEGPVTGLEVFEAVTGELKAAAASLPPTKQLSLGLVGDFEFTQGIYPDGPSPEAAATSRLNVVDGIFSEQVGVKIAIGSMTMFRDANDPFTSTAASTALDEVANWRQQTPTQQSHGLTHLLTGKNLDGSTVGIAFVGSLCRPRSSSGLSQHSTSPAIGPTSAALITAHEMGHNFGAPHDGEAGRACETTPATFLMAPQLNGSRNFSQCSLDQIAPVVAAANCLAPLAAADVAIDAPTSSVRRLRGETFDYGFSVQSNGTLSAENVTVAVQLPAGVAVNTATADGGACTIGSPSNVSCALGSVSSARALTLNLTGQSAGSGNATLSLSASNDSVSGNNSRQVGFTIDPSADLGVTLTASPASVALNASTQVTATVTNAAAGAAASDAVLSFTIPSTLTVSAVASNGLGCTLQGPAVSCAATSLAAGASQSVTLTVSGSQSGAQSMGASVRATIGDPSSGNNSGQVTITVGAAAAADGGGGGGGGRVSALLIALLSALVCLRLGRDSARTRASPVAGEAKAGR